MASVITHRNRQRLSFFSRLSESAGENKRILREKRLSIASTPPPIAPRTIGKLSLLLFDSQRASTLAELRRDSLIILIRNLGRMAVCLLRVSASNDSNRTTSVLIIVRRPFLSIFQAARFFSSYQRLSIGRNNSRKRSFHSGIICSLVPETFDRENFRSDGAFHISR